MQLKSDAQLLREYADSGAETAFGELVQRHTNLVYSAVLRQVESPAVAAEISQNIFLDLARRAEPISNRMSSEASLAGWLCRSARNLALNFRRDEYRRRIRERRHLEENMSDSKIPPDWERLRGVLDEAMGELSETDYDAVVLRFYQDQDFRAVGAAMGMSDDAAQKRVTRALEKLRDSLARRGIRTTAAALSVALLANAVSSAPAGLAVGMAGVAAAEMLAATPVATMALKTFTMTTLQKALVTATVVVLAGVGVFEGVRAARAGAEVDRLRQQQARLEQQVKLLQTTRDGAAGQAALGRADDSEQRRRLEHLELLSLRGRVGQLAGELRQQLSLAAAQAATNQDTPTNQDTALLSSSATNRVANGNTLVLGGWAVNGGRSYLLITPVIQSNDGASPAGYPFTIQSQIVSAPERFWNQIGWLDAQSGAHCSTVTMTLDADDTAMLLKAIETTPGAGASNASSSQCLDGNSVGVGWTMTDGAGVGALMSVEVVPRMAANGQSIEMEITPGSTQSKTPVHSWLRP